MRKASEFSDIFFIFDKYCHTNVILLFTISESYINLGDAKFESSSSNSLKIKLHICQTTICALRKKIAVADCAVDDNADTDDVVVDGTVADNTLVDYTVAKVYCVYSIPNLNKIWIYAVELKTNSCLWCLYSVYTQNLTHTETRCWVN